ncbi:MAG TPA: hypothetical protein VHU84_15210 [Lacipirellulaceae bacterium]|nr:hypothetical protein [Lacipirellulaceae bacterium]
MRLTLRTLLAYLDDVLDPVDKEELAHKIESSEFAEDLVHRTRDTVRRLRLSAPQVIGTGMGLDPNTVAEYLDNVMPPEQVGDFERICLESDVHLAEATACHHVLTMVLGEPADVDPIARQRMYTLGTGSSDGKRLRIEPAHTAPMAAAIPAATLSPPLAPMPSSIAPRAVEVPDYLRAGSWWQSSTAIVALAAIVLIGISLIFASGLRGWLSGKPGAEPLTAENTSHPAVAIENSASSAPEPPSNIAAETPVDAAKPIANGPMANPPQPMTPGLPPLAVASTAPPTTPAATPAARPNEPEDRYAVGNTAANIAQPPAAPVADAPPQATKPANSLPSAPPLATPPTTANNSVPTNPEISASTPSAPKPPVASGLPTPTENSSPSLPPPSNLAVSTPAPPLAATSDSSPVGTPENPAAASTTAAAPPDSGTYMGGKTVLLRYDDKAGTWFRVEPRAAIIPGERILALPEFRPRVALVSGLQLDLSGGTQVVMGGKNNAGPVAPSSAAEVIPVIEVAYGHAVLINPTNAEKQIRLKLGATGGVAKLAHNATLAVEVEPKHVPGDDPRQTPAPMEIRLFAPDGGITWQDAAGDKSFDKASRWNLTSGGATDIAADPAPPEWIDHEPIVQLSEQRYGAPVIESTLVSNAPAETQLLELFQGSSRKEVKSLIARSSIHVGLFQPFIDSLRDSEQKAFWKSHIDTLRTAMALSPESAGKVYQAFVDQRGKPAAADLYEMLCGYNADQVGHTPEQMKTGAILKLINWLEDDSLDYRVLAVQDLWEITGKRLMPNPAASLPERKGNIKVWRSRLEVGQLMKPTATKD